MLSQFISRTNLVFIFSEQEIGLVATPPVIKGEVTSLIPVRSFYYLNYIVASLTSNTRKKYSEYNLERPV